MPLKLRPHRYKDHIFTERFSSFTCITIPQLDNEAIPLFKATFPQTHCVSHYRGFTVVQNLNKIPRNHTRRKYPITPRWCSLFSARQYGPGRRTASQPWHQVVTATTKWLSLTWCWPQSCGSHRWPKDELTYLFIPAGESTCWHGRKVQQCNVKDIFFSFELGRHSETTMIWNECKFTIDSKRRHTQKDR